MKFFIHKTCPFRQAGIQRMNESRMISGYGSSSFFYWYVSSHTSINIKVYLTYQNVMPVVNKAGV
ncbi:MAG: hypothetical protein BGP14_22555 [Sphingobacteriales bacterium 44-15]|nr:MAG: hypothetical protein BGP14_22555 [Sphingobacteriales bacterium 44-15]